MGPSRTKLCENDAEMEADGSLWEHLRALNGVPNHLGNGLGITLGSVGCVWHEISWKRDVLLFRCHSAAELLFMQVWAPSWSHLDPKVMPEQPKVASKGQVGVKFGRSVRGALSNLWKLPATRRAAAQT